MAKKIIIIVIILVLIGVILLFLSTQRKVPIINQPAGNQQITNQPLVNQGVQPQPRELTVEEKLVLQKNELILKVRNFVERYGSYSTDAQFANLIELKNEMSGRLWRETENYISAKEKTSSSEALAKEEFYGVTTKVLNVKEEKYTTSEAIYLFSTQRQEIKGATPKIYYQDAELTIIKENGSWKVDQVVLH